MAAIGQIPTQRKDPKRKSQRKTRETNPEVMWCTSITNLGHTCPNRAQRVTIRGKRYQLKTCVMHASPAIKKELRLDNTGGRSNGGRPRNVSVNDILRARFEEDAQRYLKPLEDALEAMRAVVVGNGASAHIEMVEDLSTRIKAAEAIIDRIYGKPRQAVDIGGGDAPIEIEIPKDKKRQQDVAAILAETGALGTLIPQNPSANQPSSN